MEHLAVIPAKKLMRKGRRGGYYSEWLTGRKEAPYGKVRAGDRVFFKTPGGRIFGTGVARSVSQGEIGKKFRCGIGFGKVVIFDKGFSVLKNDSRRWVVLDGGTDGRQQALLPSRQKTLAEVTAAAKRVYGSIPSRRELADALAALPSAPKGKAPMGALLVLIGALWAASGGEDLDSDIGTLLTRRAGTVFPLAVFSEPRGRRASAKKRPITKKEQKLLE